jgi:hypothetical protein
MKYWNPETKEFTKAPVRDKDGKDISWTTLYMLWLRHWIKAAWKDRP